MVSSIAAAARKGMFSTLIGAAVAPVVRQTIVAEHLLCSQSPTSALSRVRNQRNLLQLWSRLTRLWWKPKMRWRSKVVPPTRGSGVVTSATGRVPTRGSTVKFTQASLLTTWHAAKAAVFRQQVPSILESGSMIKLMAMAPTDTRTAVSTRASGTWTRSMGKVLRLGQRERGTKVSLSSGASTARASTTASVAFRTKGSLPMTRCKAMAPTSSAMDGSTVANGSRAKFMALERWCGPQGVLTKESTNSIPSTALEPSPGKMAVHILDSGMRANSMAKVGPKARVVHPFPCDGCMECKSRS
mmetsp:Transcript_51579/g.122702  ORF Transcript_51579/g.122702 Transcript_51579/m.122702 type:complete len:300 (+) Transcript_51579:219-1118(+)